MNDNLSLFPGKTISFPSKQYSYIRELGFGGTGSTFLFKELSTGIFFAIKKFNPSNGNDPDECYERFVGEIKILLGLTHPNIVRVFDYFLYPEIKTGYIVMEYIDGETIGNFALQSGDKNWNRIFSEIISAFEAMEARGVLHRDIKPNNIMINDEGAVKIIDYGFGKQFSDDTGREANSVLLNWPASTPDEIVRDCQYDHRTEMYYLGKMLSGLVGSNDSFDYMEIVEKMADKNPENRFGSFADIRGAINDAAMNLGIFTEAQRTLYQRFADELTAAIGEFKNSFIPVKNADEVLRKIGEVIRESSLEKTLQENSHLISCFVRNNFTYYPGYEIQTSLIRDFGLFFSSLSNTGRQHVLQNLSVRLGKISIEYDFDEDIPF